MHINDIKGVAKRAALDAKFYGKNTPVRISTVKDGKLLYLAGARWVDGIQFAMPYRYDDDSVGEQVQALATMGITIDVEEYKEGL